MIHNIFAATTRTISIMAPIIFIAYGFIFALIIICLLRVSRYFMSAGKEQKLIRMELGKLAEEVHLLRQNLKDDKDTDSSDKSD
jgi:hypothetical protein